MSLLNTSLYCDRYHESITFSGALIGYSISEYLALFTDSPPVSPSERRQTHVSCDKREWSWCKVKKKNGKSRRVKVMPARDDSQRRFLAQASKTMLQRCVATLFPYCNVVLR